MRRKQAANDGQQMTGGRWRRTTTGDTRRGMGRGGRRWCLKIIPYGTIESNRCCRSTALS